MGLIVALFGIAAFYLWPTRKVIGSLSLGGALVLALLWAGAEGFGWFESREHPWLSDRYAEQWGGPVGASIILDQAIPLPSMVGKQQMFTPVVHAPQNIALSNVWLNVCIPVSFRIAPVNPEQFAIAWELQETTQCARYTTRFERIAKGAGLNPREAIHFKPQVAGDFTINYSIVSTELQPYFGAFQVRVTP